MHPHIPEGEQQPQYTEKNTERVMSKMWDLFDEVKKRREWLETVRQNELSDTKQSLLAKQIADMTVWLHKVSVRIHDRPLSKLTEKEFWNYMEQGEGLLGIQKEKNVILLSKKERAA